MAVQPTFRRSILVSLAFVTLCFGWWPFSFNQANDIRLLESEGALSLNPGHESGQFWKRGIVYGNHRLDTTSWQGVTLRIEARGRPRSNGLGVLLEFFDPESEHLPELQISQWKEHLSVRSRRSVERIERGYSEIGYKGAYSPDEFREIILASEGERTHLYIDGEIVESVSNFSLLGERNRFRGVLLIGNSSNGELPFLGEVKRVRIYDRFYRAKSKALQEALPNVDINPALGRYGEDGSIVIPGVAIPDRFRAPNPNRFNGIGPAHLRKSSYRSDMVINLLGFIPVGICFAAAARRRTATFGKAALVVVLASFSLSFLIEGGQYFLVHRDSSQLDLILNTIGGSLGLLVPRRWILFL